MNAAFRIFWVGVLILSISGCNKGNNAQRTPGDEGSIKVLAVNNGWIHPFVVLGMGNSQGLEPNTEMALRRGDSEICKVRVSEIQAHTCVAEVIPGSLAAGAVPEAGDRAVLVGKYGL